MRPLQRKTFGSRGSAELPRNSWRTICLTTLPISNLRSMRILLFGTRAQSTTRIMSGMKTITRRPYSGPELSFVQKISSTGRPFGRARIDLRRCRNGGGSANHNSGTEQCDVTFAVDVELARDVAHLLHNCSKGFDSRPLSQLLGRKVSRISGIYRRCANLVTSSPSI